jgi:hypothetical protein
MKGFILIAAAMLTPAAFAADTAPATTPPATETIPTMSCSKPQLQLDPAGKLKNPKELQTQVNTYQSCIDSYIAERKQAVNLHEAAAKANRDAGNAAVKEFNDFAAEISAAQQKK